MDALNFANGLGGADPGAADFGSKSDAMAATRGCGFCAPADGTAATANASTPALMQRTRGKRRDEMATGEVMWVGTTAPGG